MAQRFNIPYPQVFDSTPSALSGAKLFFYESLTSTKLNTYSDESLSVANTNPVVLNSAGRPDVAIFLQNLPYKVVLAPSTDSDPPTSPIWSADPVYTTDIRSVLITKTGSGSPNGVVAGTAGSSGVLATAYWDYTNAIEYRCTTTGNAATAVWTAINASSATPAVSAPQGYLTPSGFPPVIVSDSVSGVALAYEQFVGNLVPIYNGARFVPTEFSPMFLDYHSSHSTNTIYDVFVFSNAGVLTLVTGPAWNNSGAGTGARGTGAGTTQLTRLSGYWVNAVAMTGRNGSTTHSIGANLATYLGSIFIDGTAGQVTCHRAWGASRKWGIWNAYNRQPLYLKAGDSTAAWNYNTATIRASRDQATNSLTIFSGLPEEFYDLAFSQYIRVVGDDDDVVTARTGIGFNSTTVMSGQLGMVGTQDAAVTNARVHGNGQARFLQVPSIGIHVVTALENVPLTGNTVEWFGGEDDMVLSAKWRG